MKPEISVCIPTKNRKAYLRRAIDNLKKQTFRNFEIVVSDNASSDGTANMVRCLEDPQVRLVETSNVDRATNWNRAIRHANGEVIVFLSDDDGLYDADYLQEVRNLFWLFNDTEIAFPRRVRVVDEKGKPKYTTFLQNLSLLNTTFFKLQNRYFEIPQETALERELESNSFALSGSAFRRTAFEEMGSFEEVAGISIDHYQWLKACLFNDIRVFDRTVEYTMRADSILAERHWNKDVVQLMFPFDEMMAYMRLKRFAKKNHGTDISITKSMSMACIRALKYRTPMSLRDIAILCVLFLMNDPIGAGFAAVRLVINPNVKYLKE